MRYIALLRGINVGGNNVIKMAALREVVGASGFDNVSSYIQTGNVIFEAKEVSSEKIEEVLEVALSAAFDYSARVVVVSQDELAQVVAQVPEGWKTENQLRCYIAFLKRPLTAGKAIEEAEPKEGVDVVTAGPDVLYMSTLLSGLTRSGINKLIRKSIYKDMTIRNYNTTRKILARSEQNQ